MMGDLEREIDALRVGNARLREALKGMLAEWDKMTRYGSPLAKAANENVNRARALAESMAFSRVLNALSARPNAADSVQEDAKSLAQMTVEWVDGGITMNLDWRPRLASVIEKRLRRLQNEHAVAALSARPDVGRSE